MLECELSQAAVLPARWTVAMLTAEAAESSRQPIRDLNRPGAREPVIGAAIQYRDEVTQATGGERGQRQERRKSFPHRVCHRPGRACLRNSMPHLGEKELVDAGCARVCREIAVPGVQLLERLPSVGVVTRHVGERRLELPPGRSYTVELQAGGV